MVADLSRHDPSAPNPDDPLEHDGTTNGSVTSAGSASGDRSLSDATDRLVRTYWTPDWPILNMLILDPLNTGTALLHFGLDLLNTVYVYTEQLAAWIDSIIDFVGDKASIVVAIIQELAEKAFEIIGVVYAFHYALAGWVLVDTVKFMDLSTTVLLASIATAALVTIGFVGLAYLAAISAGQIFGPDEAAVIWLIVLLEALLVLGKWYWGKLNPNAIASTVIRISQFTSSLWGPFPSEILILCWWSWATYIFLRGVIALAIANMAVLFQS
ncbi:MAG: hypothetical protein HXY34_06655 [Candidatus Thorarchaeota archaeon]|nr:hypothetical protein [Candidatus Thorarchaeota archaeon]